mgnify:CR=1 FL=1
MTSLRIDGLDELNKTLSELPSKFEQEAGRLVNRTAKNVRNNAIYLIRTPSMGRTYVQYKPYYKTHIASAPGDAPNRDTGQLGSSLIVTRSGSTSVEVLANVEYAAYLEFGTRNMAARPFMTPAVEQELPKYEQGLRELTRRAAK